MFGETTLRYLKQDLRERRTDARRDRRRSALGMPMVMPMPMPMDQPCCGDHSGEMMRYRGADTSRADLAANGGLLEDAQGIIPPELVDSKKKRRADALQALFGADLAGLPPQVTSFAMAELEKVEAGGSVTPEALREIARVSRSLAVVCKSEGRDYPLQIKKYDDELQVVWGEVYIPDLPDSQGDFMTANEIRKAAWRFAEHGRLRQIDSMHDNQLAAFAVETFVARKGDPLFIEGAWVLGVHVPDSDIWQRVKKGELNGFSMEGSGTGIEKQFEIELPDEVKGETLEADGHTHAFVVKFGDQGQFLGGEALPGGADKHTHVIQRGTVTEIGGGQQQHTHRFSISEGILEVSVGLRPPTPEQRGEE